MTLPVDAGITLALLAVTFLLLFATRLPPTVIFLGALTAAITLGLAPVTDLLKGFSNPGVLTVGVLFMVAEGMYSTGAITLIADRVVGLPATLTAAQVSVLGPVALGSSFLNNTPLVAMMIPVVRDIARSTQLAASRLYLPLSYASILGGASTLIGTSTNLIIAGLIIDAIAAMGAEAPPMERASIFFPTPVGLVAAAVGLIFLVLAGPRLLPGRKKEEGEEAVRRLYGAEFFIAADSYLRGKTLEASGLAHAEGFRLASVRRSGRPAPAVEPGLTLREGDVLTFSTDTDGLPALWATIGLVPLNTLSPQDTERHRHRLVEGVVSPQNSYLGRTIGDLPAPREPYEVKIVALSRNGTPPAEPLREVRIEAGDNVVLEVNDPFFFQNRNEQEYLILKRLRGYRIKMESSGGLVVAAPVYFGYVPAMTKAWLDRLVPYIGMDMSPTFPGSCPVSFIFVQNMPDPSLFEPALRSFTDAVAMSNLAVRECMIAPDCERGVKPPVTERPDQMEREYALGRDLIAMRPEAKNEF
ncbi:SLC13 family permease [Methanofollis ethanolicus]|uniref:SLC13 family permease n=1 Tax=Methanofollis ethanolicus TaxID=488124 RepID=UPI00082A5811|nr:SLC13 family permease [Methanofollis ethanolicus]